jgi:hypothetical protein
MARLWSGRIAARKDREFEAHPAILLGAVPD